MYHFYTWKLPFHVFTFHVFTFHVFTFHVFLYGPSPFTLQLLDGGITIFCGYNSVSEQESTMAATP
jgi:hypothetical protein